RHVDIRAIPDVAGALALHGDTLQFRFTAIPIGPRVHAAHRLENVRTTIDGAHAQVRHFHAGALRQACIAVRVLIDSADRVELVGAWGVRSSTHSLGCNLDS